MTSSNLASDALQLAEFSRSVRESSLKRLRPLDFEHVNWRPTPGSLSIADIAQHLIDMDRWLFAKLRDPGLTGMKAAVGCSSVSAPPEYQRLVDTLGELGQERFELIASLAPADFQRRIPDDRFGGIVSVWWVIVRGNLDHEIHHRGQLATYLRILAG